MSGVRTARALAWFSLALGTVEVVAGGRLAGALGFGRSATLVRAFGVRELAAGGLILARPDTPGGVWARVAGDALDLAVLGLALRPRNPRRGSAALAAAAVAAVTVADIRCARSLQAQVMRRQAVARRTRSA